VKTCEMSKSAKATKLALSLPRDAKGKFLPRGSKNLFKKKVKKNNKTHNTHKKKRKRRTSHGSHLGASSVLDLLDPIQDVITLLAPLLGGSHTVAHKKRVDNFQTLITGKNATKSKPMAKRRRNNNGNGKRVDIFPNFLTGTVTQGAVDSFTTVLVNTPIPRIQTTRSGQRATVMELLWIEVLFPNIKMEAPNTSLMTIFTIGTTPTAVLPFNNPRVFAEVRLDSHVIVAGTDGRATMSTRQPWIYQMQSMDGHGYLLAAESFHVSIFSTATVQQNIVEWRMYYRFIDIPLSEFIGLVQSTQQ